MKVLVTGFEPFGGDAVDASADAVEALAASWAGPDELVTAVLPVAFDEVRAVDGPLLRLLDEHAPDVVVAVGLADGITKMQLEQVAINLMDARIPTTTAPSPSTRPWRTAVPPPGSPPCRSRPLPPPCARRASPRPSAYSAGTYVPQRHLLRPAARAGGAARRALRLRPRAAHH